MDRILRFGLVAAVAIFALLIPTQAGGQTPPPVIEVQLSLTDLPAPIVNVSVPEQDAPVITFPEIPAPVVDVQVTVPEQAPPVVNVDVQPGEPQVIYRDREVEKVVEVPVETIVEVPVEVERVVEVERLVEVERIVICNPTDGRERNFAFITDGLVTNVAGGSGSDFANFIEAVAGQGQEVTCLDPMPWIGWTFDGTDFAPPQ